MHFQFNSDNHSSVEEGVVDTIEALVRQKLDNVSDRITRVELHLSDVNGPRGGDDMRCVVELRPTGMEPVSATNEAATAESAAAGATEKALSALRRQIGKQTTRKGH